ncbi:hypothetical protein ACOTGA_23410 [Achromobacter xylosoxidans]
MTALESPAKPFYKRLGFWLLLAFALCALFAAGAPKAPDGKQSADGALATVLAMLLLIAVFLNHLYQRVARRRRAKAQTDAVSDAYRQRLENITANGISPVVTDKLIARSEEKAYFASQGTLYETKTVSVRHGGVSMRFQVAKGVSVSTGGGRSTPESKLVPVAEGELIATNQRVVFAGSGKSFDTPLSKIINVEYFNDGVLINVSNRQTSLFVGLPRGDVALFEEVFRQILERHDS